MQRTTREPRQVNMKQLDQYVDRYLDRKTDLSICSSGVGCPLTVLRFGVCFVAHLNRSGRDRRIEKGKFYKGKSLGTVERTALMNRL